MLASMSSASPTCELPIGSRRRRLGIESREAGLGRQVAAVLGTKRLFGHPDARQHVFGFADVRAPDPLAIGDACDQGEDADHDHDDHHLDQREGPLAAYGPHHTVEYRIWTRATTRPPSRDERAAQRPNLLLPYM